MAEAEAGRAAARRRHELAANRRMGRAPGGEPGAPEREDQHDDLDLEAAAVAFGNPPSLPPGGFAQSQRSWYFRQHTSDSCRASGHWLSRAFRRLAGAQCIEGRFVRSCDLPGVPQWLVTAARPTGVRRREPR